MTRRDEPELSLVPAPSVLPQGPVVVATPNELLSAFLEGRNPRTLKAYRQDLEDFRAFLKQETSSAAAALLLAQDQGRANAIAHAYRADMKKRQLRGATINRRLAALRSLVKFARMLGLVSFSLDVKNVKMTPYRDTRGPGRDGVRELLGELAARNDKKGARDRAIIRLLYDLALRTGEVLSLDLSNLDLRTKTLWVLGKGEGERARLTLPEKTCDALRAWLKFRGKEEGPLFVPLDADAAGERLSPTGLYRLVRKLGEKAGLRARPHGLRHAAITEALNRTGGDVRAVQRFSRHKDLRVLCVYDDARTDIAGEVASLVAKST